MHQVPKRRSLSFRSAFTGCVLATFATDGFCLVDTACLVQKTCGGEINQM